MFHPIHQISSPSTNSLGLSPTIFFAAHQAKVKDETIDNTKAIPANNILSLYSPQPYKTAINITTNIISFMLFVSFLYGRQTKRLHFSLSAFTEDNYY